MENEVTKKKCKACSEEKELFKFYKNSKNKDGLFSKCKSCVDNKIKIPKKCNINNGFKVCRLCDIEKTIDSFTSCEQCIDKYQNACKSCNNIKKKDYRENNIEKAKEWSKNWRETNKEYKSKKAKEWYLKNKDSVLDRVKERYINKKEEINEYTKQWHSLNREYLNEKERQRKLEDPIYKLISRTRTLIGNSFKRGCEKSFKKPQKSENILGCTMQEFIEHLQSLFTEGMTLENHGQCEECWHIDHKIPISSAKTEEDIIKLNHYTNLQPLWSRDNLTKSKKYE